VGYGESEESFVRWFEFLSEAPYLKLYRCRHCGTLWKLDVGDRSDFAIKIPSISGWESFDDRPARRQFFIDFHGGEGTEICCWAGCGGRVLNQMAICIDHAYPEFAPNRGPL
jgi:hypothetical protein